MCIIARDCCIYTRAGVYSRGVGTIEVRILARRIGQVSGALSEINLVAHFALIFVYIGAKWGRLKRIYDVQLKVVIEMDARAESMEICPRVGNSGGENLFGRKTVWPR